MRVGIDVYPLSSAHKYRGTGFYTKRLVDEITLIDKKNEYILFNSKEGDAGGVDLVHYPYFSPFFLTLPISRKTKIVVTVHDLIPLVFPKFFPRGIKGEIKWQIQRMNLANVDAIITDSRSSKNDILKFVPIESKKVFVIPLAPGSEFKVPTEEEKIRVRTKYNLPEKFILYVGDVNEHKNILGLLDAFSKISEKEKSVFLVLAGKAIGEDDLPETKKITEKIRDLKLGDRVIRLSTLPFDSNEDLAVVYNLATVYVQPSFYEGFGLPVLEAMVCGTPAVVSRVASLPEAGGEAAIYMDPYDTEDMVEKIMPILTMDAKSYEDLKEKGISWASKFSWRSVALQTIKVYESI